MKIEMINIDELRPDPNQPRKTSAKINPSSFEHHGTINPIEIDDNNVIICGELRWRAAKKAGLKEIPCIRKRGLTVEKRLERQLVENLNRKNLELVDVLPAVKKLLKFNQLNLEKGSNRDEGMKKLAGHIGVSETWLSQVLGVDKHAPEPVKKAWKEKKIKTKVAVELQKLKPKTQEKILPRLEKLGQVPSLEIINRIKNEEKFKEDKKVFSYNDYFDEWERRWEKVMEYSDIHGKVTPRIIENMPQAIAKRIEIHLLRLVGYHRAIKMRVYGNQIDWNEIPK